MWMRQLSSRCTGHFGIFTLTSRRCLADAGAQRSISRPCWYSLGSGATLRTCRRRWGQPEGCRFLTDSPWDDEVIIGRLQPAGATGRGGVLDGSDFPHSVGVARQYCRRLPAARGHWWTRGCICPRVGPRTKTGVRRRVCRRIGRATGPRRSWPWRWWGGHRSGAT